MIFGSPRDVKSQPVVFAFLLFASKLEEHDRVSSLLLCVSELDLTRDSNTKTLMGTWKRICEAASKVQVDTLNPNYSSNSTHQHSSEFSEEKYCSPTRHRSIRHELTEACTSNNKGHSSRQMTWHCQSTSGLSSGVRVLHHLF